MTFQVRFKHPDGTIHEVLVEGDSKEEVFRIAMKIAKDDIKVESVVEVLIA